MSAQDNTTRPIAFTKSLPPGDDLERAVCDHCGFISYENPKIVVGSVVRHEGRILLCRRAIEPRRGYWTLPAGYLELNEMPQAGAAREAWEEARAKLSVHELLAVYSVPRISQVQLIYRATLAEPGIEAGPESEEVAFFAPDEIPRGEIAFPTVHWALRHDALVAEGLGAPPFSNPDEGDPDHLPDGSAVADR